ALTAFYFHQRLGGYKRDDATFDWKVGGIVPSF
ncbi:unnamed protein product, partial [marine sediment metagenome]